MCLKQILACDAALASEASFYFFMFGSLYSILSNYNKLGFAFPRENGDFRPKGKVGLFTTSKHATEQAV
jgi:hypothetical protein